MSQEQSVAVTLENRLMSQGVYVTALDIAGADIDLEYEMVHDQPGVTTHEVGLVVRTILQVAEERDSWEPGRLEARAYSTSGDRRGDWHVRGEWITGLGDSLTEIEFSERVLNTITHENMGK